MKSMLKQLQDDEAILLMYLAGELPPGDRQIVEQRLASDEAFGQLLQSMSELQEFCQKSIRALDEQSPAEATESAAMRRAGRLLRQWALLRRRPMEAAQIAPRPIPWLRYGLSTAAVIGLAYLVWWGNRPGSAPVYPGAPSQENTVAVDTVPSDVKLSMLLDTMDASAADDVSDRQVAAADAKSDEINFAVEVPKQDDSQ
ncbi:MAG: hypothetical protein ABSF29_03465 [Tepidisphaeraceae bacterium]|jgi:anti-sigma factor RsiW